MAAVNAGDATILRVARIDDDVRPTGSTRHSSGELVDGEIVAGETLGPFAALAIVEEESSSGYLLLYLDQNGDSVADTWHETLEDAMDQAEHEYEGITSKWVTRERGDR
jgi:hypothetical protein